MNPLIPNAYELIIFYIIPALIFIGLVIFAFRFFASRKNRPEGNISPDDSQSGGE